MAPVTTLSLASSQSRLKTERELSQASAQKGPNPRRGLHPHDLVTP